MARQQMINTTDDMSWLRDVHLPRLPAKYKSAIIVGNEDYPERIEVYEARNPVVTDVPVIFVADEEGVFREKQATRHHATLKSSSGVRAVGGPYTVYYEKAGGEPVKTSAPTRRQAVQLACAASKMTGGYVTVSHKGIEVAACYGGEVVEGRGRHATKSPAQRSYQYRAIVAGTGLLIGGTKRHVSSWFPTKKEADDWAWAISTTNQAARRAVAYVTIERRHGSVIETVKWAHAGEVEI